MLWQLDACGLAAAYRGGKVTPIDVVREFLARIGRLDPEVNAFTAIADDAESQAVESARRLAANSPVGPLDGIPIAVKDNLVVRGLPATWGSRVFADGTCDHDELPIRRLRDAGAIIIGKTNAPEFAVEGYTANALFGVTRNPWNLDLTPGGSSGGSVAAVAAGFAPVAIGTDGGGSIRRPAAYTGLYGLKPTIGAVPRSGGLPQVLLDFEVVGPVARSARDLRLIHSVLAGADRSDPRSRMYRPEAHAGDEREAVKILYVDRFADAPCDPVILTACDAAAHQLVTLGYKVERAELPFDLTELNQYWSTIAQVGLARMRQDIPRMRTHASPQYLQMADEGEKVSATAFLAVIDVIADLRSAVSQAFREWHAIMTPACAAMPWPASEPFPGRIDGTAVGPRGHAVYTGWVNACGHPAVTLPASPAPSGLPVGFQLVGDLASEQLLLEMAGTYEKTASPWTWPAIAKS